MLERGERTGLVEMSRCRSEPSSNWMITVMGREDPGGCEEKEDPGGCEDPGGREDPGGCEKEKEKSCCSEGRVRQGEESGGTRD